MNKQQKENILRTKIMYVNEAFSIKYRKEINTLLLPMLTEFIKTLNKQGIELPLDKYEFYIADIGLMCRNKKLPKKEVSCR